MKTMLADIRRTLREHARPETVQFMLRVIPGAQKAHGVKMPVINLLAKKFRSGDFELAEALWKSGVYEERMVAAKILTHVAKKNPERALNIVKTFSAGLSDWAICDTLGMQSLQKIRKTHHAEIFALAGKLARSKNFWQRRLSLVLVEWYTRDALFHPAILALRNQLSSDKEHYVKKAVEWIDNSFRRHD